MKLETVQRLAESFLYLKEESITKKKKQK